MEWNEHEPLSDAELDEVLSEWKIASPPERLSAVRLGLRRPRAWRVWLPIAACLAIAAAAVAISRKPTPPPRPAQQESTFLPIPYTLPLAEGESASVVRMNLSVAALLSVGFRLPAADPTATVTADVLVAEDGQPRAVRLVNPDLKN
jgi:hypothetical protein